MRAVDLAFAEMLREVLEAKINKSRRDMLDTYMPVEVERIQAQIMAYQWIQARIQDMVINININNINNNESKDTKVRI
ncbi:MAG: hypothetical protein ACJ71O_03755 [Nitrososphaeraceae archaeon]